MYRDHFLALMYHNVVRDGELQRGPCARLSPSITTYFVEESTFREHLQQISAIAESMTMADVETFYKHASRPQRSSNTRNAAATRPRVLITFDDGWRGCLDVATEALREAGMQGLLFVTTSLVGSDYFSSWDDLRNRDKSVWRIGSHTVSHGFLNEESTRTIYKELRLSKRELENQLKERVNILSIPNGAVSDRVQLIAEDVGYSHVFTSEVQFNDRETNPYSLGRFAVRRSTTTADIEQWMQGQIRAAVWKRTLLQIPKFLLGPRQYRFFRRRWLGESDDQLPMTQLTSDPAVGDNSRLEVAHS